MAFYLCGGVFWRPTFTLSFNMFRFSIFCYDLEIIDSIKNGTCVANFLQVSCSIEFQPSQPLVASYSGKACQRSVILGTCIDIKDIIETIRKQLKRSLSGSSIGCTHRLISAEVIKGVIYIYLIRRFVV